MKGAVGKLQTLCCLALGQLCEKLFYYFCISMHIMSRKIIFVNTIIGLLLRFSLLHGGSCSGERLH